MTWRPNPPTSTAILNGFMVEGMTERWIIHPPPGIQIQAMPLKVGNVTFTFNVSLFSCFIVGRSFSFRFVWPYFCDKSLSFPKHRCQDRENYPLLSGADAKSTVRYVTGQHREHGARGSGYRIGDAPLWLKGGAISRTRPPFVSSLWP